MRQFLYVLLLACLVVRWADAACGCAHHNGWVTAAAHLVGAEHHESSEGHDVAFEHACCAEGRAVYAAGVRVTLTDVPTVGVCAVSPIDVVASADGAAAPGCWQQVRSQLSRSRLQVWRI